MFRRLVLTGAFLAFANLGHAQTGQSLIESVPSITVDGMAKREVAPDLAIATVGVDTVRGDATQASADNAKAAAAFVAAARQLGLSSADITTSDLRLSAITETRDTSKVKGFRASNHVSFRVRDLGKLPALLGSLVTQGANTIEGVDFTVDNPRPVLDELRAEAVRNATDEARTYAKAAGVSLGRILRIAPEVSASMPMPRAFKVQMADAAAPAPPVEAGSQTLESHVRVTWELVP